MPQFQLRHRLVLSTVASICCVLIFLYLQRDSASFSLPALGIQKEPATEEPSWLIWTSSAAHLRQRREIIRSTWQTYYRNASFEPYFVIGSPGPEWLPLIQQENRTYGDMIMLEGHGDNKEFATTIKAFETVKFFRDRALITGKKWTFLSKIDDDSFLQATAFRNDFLAPHQHSKRKIISRVVQYSRPHVFPGGQFYTLTWDLVELIAHLYETTTRDLVHDMDLPERKLTKRHEDFMVADLMVEAGEDFDYVELSDERAFDIITEGNVTERAINPHRLKSDEQYLWLAAMFDEDGYRGSERDGINLEEKLRQSAPKQT